MSAYKHGVYTSEEATSIISPVEATAGLQVVVGTAPINLAKTDEYVKKPLLAYTLAEAVQGLGYSDDWENYTLCEVMDATFRLYGVAPVVFINVLDPKKHISTEENNEVEVVNKKAIIDVKGILLDLLKVKLSSDGQDLTKDKDYTASFDDTGNVIITFLDDSVPSSQTKIYVSYTKLEPSKVTEADIIGGIDANTGEASGLELVNSVFPKFGMVPGQILAPKFSKNPTVAAVMRAKAANVNTYFKAMSLDDINSEEANTYSKVAEWKNTNNYTAANEIPCWPKVAMGDKKYHLSTHIAALCALIDSENDDLPYVSPSNKSLQINKAIVEGGTEINLDPNQAAYLNGQGIITTLNFIGGWKAWGNRTGAYPSTTDVKDTFIPVRRMHNWIGNTIVLTVWEKVDSPANRRLIDSVVDSLNVWLNGLTTTGALLGGRVEFRDEDNPTTDLLNGTVRFRVFLAEPTPSENIEFILEFDATYYNRLFE